MDIVEIILTFFNILGSIIGIVAIIIVIWDHYKDNKLLTQRVQSFYETIENLIITFYMEEYDEEKNENEFHHLPFDVNLSRWGEELYGDCPISIPAENSQKECEVGDVGY